MYFILYFEKYHCSVLSKFVVRVVRNIILKIIFAQISTFRMYKSSLPLYRVVKAAF